MNQRAWDLEFDAIVAGLEPFPVRLAHHEATGEPDIQRIASAVFCSIGIDPSIVAFAVRRTAQHRGLPEDAIDVAVTVALLASAARLMHDLRPLDAR
jgi:hypothetical protein